MIGALDRLQSARRSLSILQHHISSSFPLLSHSFSCMRSCDFMPGHSITGAYDGACDGACVCVDCTTLSLTFHDAITGTCTRAVYADFTNMALSSLSTSRDLSAAFGTAIFSKVSDGSAVQGESWKACEETSSFGRSSFALPKGSLTCSPLFFMLQYLSLYVPSRIPELLSALPVGESLSLVLFNSLSFPRTEFVELFVPCYAVLSL
jgi:hypothetical protein